MKKDSWKRIVALSLALCLLAASLGSGPAVALAEERLGDPLPPMHFYFGVLHAHTAYSDGRGTPAEAFAFARDTSGLDFLAITEHAELLSESEWADVQLQAEAYTIPGTFLGLRGFEWTDWLAGHANVLATPVFTSWLDPETNTVSKFYEWLEGQAGAIAQFNHPDPSDFHGLAYDPRVDGKFSLFEVANSEGDYEDSYILALDQGWHVGAVNNQDNHHPDWGSADNLTGVVADSLSVDSILGALRARRTYGTENRDLRLTFQANGQWMGSMLPCPAGQLVRFQVSVEDPLPSDPINRVELVTNGGAIVASETASGNRLDWHPEYGNPGGNHWFYIRVTMASGARAISSPIWLTPGNPASATLTFQAGWNLFSLPVGTTTPAALLFAGLEPYSLFRWDATIQTYEIPQTLRLGEAAWLKANQPVSNLTFSGEVFPGWPVHLCPGWNMVGTPSPSAFSTGELWLQRGQELRTLAQAYAEGWLKEGLWSWDGHAYQDATKDPGSMLPGLGYWLKANAPLDLLFPAE